MATGFEAAMGERSAGGMTRLGLQVVNRLSRYLSAGIVALAADSGSFLALMRAGLNPVAAAALGFGVGIAVNWVVASSLMFASDIAPDAAQRARQRMLFVVTALLGLAMTTGIIAACTAMGLDPRLGKLIAVAVSFTVTSALRDWLIFDRTRFAAEEIA